MNAWFVNFDDTDSAYVLAETLESAKEIALAEWMQTCGFVDTDPEVRQMTEDGYPEVTPVPALDGETITERQLIEGGYMGRSECPCGNMIYCDNDPVFDNQGRAYCSEECRERPSPVWTGQSTIWMLSTEY